MIPARDVPSTDKEIIPARDVPFTDKEMIPARDGVDAHAQDIVVKDRLLLPARFRTLHVRTACNA
jgi:hypothetical protein